MNNQKWQVGPVKLVNGSDATIFRFCKTRQRYIGEVFMSQTQAWHACEWHADGTNWSGGDLLNLAPPPKKKVRVKFWVNVYEHVKPQMHSSKQIADENANNNRFACIEIDREVEEGEGLSCQ